MTGHEGDKVGSRWLEILDRVRMLRLSEHEMTFEQRSFLIDTEARLVRYQTNTALTVRQRNWITHIEAEFLEQRRAPL